MLLTHGLAGKDTLPRGAVVFCTCGAALYAPFSAISYDGRVQPGDLQASMAVADRRWQWHLADVSGRPRVVPVLKMKD